MSYDENNPQHKKQLYDYLTDSGEFAYKRKNKTNTEPQRLAKESKSDTQVIVNNGNIQTKKDFIKSLPLDVLKRITLDQGGLVDFSKMTAEDMKSIFRSIMGRNPKDTKELVRIIKLDMKGMDEKGIPYGVFE